MADNKELETTGENTGGDPLEFTKPSAVLTKDTLDINENVGSFGNVETPVDDLDEQEKTGVKIDFERFEKKNKQKKNVFGKVLNYSNGLTNWMFAKLENKKSLAIIWGVSLLVIALLVCGAVLFGYYVSDDLKHGDGTNGGLNALVSVRLCGYVGTIFAYISVAIIVLPLLVLLVCWFVGINGVYKSVKFHLFYWGVLTISFLLMVIAIILCSIYLSEFNKFISYIPPAKEETAPAADA